MYYNKSYWLKLIPPHNLADKLVIRSESNIVAAEEFYIEILVIPYFFQKPTSEKIYSNAINIIKGFLGNKESDFFFFIFSLHTFYF